MKSKINEAEAAGCTRLFSLRHDFPVAWAAYKDKDAPKVEGKYRPITITLTQHYPFWSKTSDGKQRKVGSAVVIARGTGPFQVATDDGTKQDELGAFVGDLWRTKITNAPKPPFTGEWKAALTADGVEDAWLLVQWGKTA